MTNILATLAFGSVVFGLWLERPSLAFIVPGCFILACLIYDRLRGKRDA